MALIAMAGMLKIPVACIPPQSLRSLRRCNWNSTLQLNRALNQLVEFATVKPDASTSWAIVNLNTLTF